jgi:hypothetical protein
MEPKGSLSHSDVHATCPYPESAQSSPCPHPEIFSEQMTNLVGLLTTAVSLVPRYFFTPMNNFTTLSSYSSQTHDLKDKSLVSA